VLAQNWKYCDKANTVCDGMFEMCPDTAYQLHTLQGFYEGKVAPLVWALLPYKVHATYEELFKAIHDAMVNTFGDAGSKHMFLLDYELAAIRALRVILQDAVLKGCAFHFQQAVL